MLAYIFKKIIALIPKALIISILIFIGFELIPGDALSRSMDPARYAQMTEVQREERREAMGLNDPAYIRYFRWLEDIANGNFGYSVINKAPVKDMLVTRVPATLKLSLLGLSIAAVFGILLGFLSAKHQNKWPDYSLTTLGLVGISVPSFFFGMIFILLFGVRLAWFPVGGQPSISDVTFLDRFKYLILPATSMALLDVGSLIRYTRNSMLDVMNKDYIKTARAKGSTENSVYWKHCFRNGCTPVVIVLINMLPALLSGTALIETIYNYQGIGSLMINAINTADVQVAMSILLICTFAVLAASFLCDIAVALLDPRVRFGKE